MPHLVFGAGNWAAAVWAIFKVPGDPKPNPTVPVSGRVRLAIEAALIGLAAYGVWTSGSRAAAETLLTALALHYAVTWERVAWLARGGPRAPGGRRL